MKIKTITLSIAFVLAAIFSIQAQDDMYTVMAQEACDCMDSKGSSSADLEAQLGMCILESFTTHPEFLAKFDLTDEAAMEKVGEKIGMEMVGICPVLFMGMMGDEDFMGDDEEENDEYFSIQGIISGFEGTDMQFVLVKTDDDSIHKMLWLGSFSGDEKLMELGQKAVGQKVVVEYEEEECYSPKLHKYVNRKEISNIEFLND